MIEDLIDDGDLVVVRPQDTAENGDIVVALLMNHGASSEGVATLKRLYRERGQIRLQPANAAMQPIFVDPEHGGVGGLEADLAALAVQALQGGHAFRRGAVVHQQRHHDVAVLGRILGPHHHQIAVVDQILDHRLPLDLERVASIRNGAGPSSR